MRYVIALESPTVAITQGEREFFGALGARVARLRNNAHITQVQLAKTLGVSHQTINTYQLGNRRIPVSALPVLARELGVGLEELLGETKAATNKRRPAPKLQQPKDPISQLPKPQQRFVIQVPESVLTQQGR